MMIGLDFSDTGGTHGLRVLITLEAPAAVALVSFWLIDAQTGTLDLTEVPARVQSLGPTNALLLLLPILIALVARVALAPLQHWVVVGSRVGAASRSRSASPPGGPPRGSMASRAQRRLLVVRGTTGGSSRQIGTISVVEVGYAIPYQLDGNGEN